MDSPNAKAKTTTTTNGFSAPTVSVSSRPAAEAVPEDRGQHAEGGAERDQVGQDRLDRHDQRAGHREQQHQHGQHGDADRQRQPVADQPEQVAQHRGVAGDPGLAARRAVGAHPVDQVPCRRALRVAGRVEAHRSPTARRRRCRSACAGRTWAIAGSIRPPGGPGSSAAASVRATTVIAGARPAGRSGRPACRRPGPPRCCAARHRDRAAAARVASSGAPASSSSAIVPSGDQRPAGAGPARDEPGERVRARRSIRGCAASAVPAGMV